MELIGVNWIFPNDAISRNLHEVFCMQKYSEIFLVQITKISERLIRAIDFQYYSSEYFNY